MSAPPAILCFCSIRGKAPSFNVSVGDCTPTEKSKWNTPPIEAWDILLLVIFIYRYLKPFGFVC